MNWTDMINDLLQRGYTFKSIGENIGMTGENVRALVRNHGQQPRWEAGNSLIKLHGKVMRRKAQVN